MFPGLKEKWNVKEKHRALVLSFLIPPTFQNFHSLGETTVNNLTEFPINLKIVHIYIMGKS